MKRVIVLCSALLALATPGYCQSVEDMSAKRLQEAASAASAANNAELLLKIYQEMERRDMLLFRIERVAICDRLPARTGYFKEGHPFHYGVANQWYFMKLRELRLSERSCECLAAAASFDELLNAHFNVVSETLTKEIFFAVRDDYEANTSRIRQEYRTFVSANCRKE